MLENNNSKNNTRIAKNTLMLYFRMFFGMSISLYTSRVVLDVLGVEDFGIYGLIGGVILMFSFITSSMSTATSRFLAYMLGKGDQKNLQKTFSSALTIHIGIAIIILIIAETFGVWFIENKLLIAADRMFAAQVIFHFSVASSVLQIILVPFNALIISHEKMNVYAYIEIVKYSLKLAIVYLLIIGDYDKLILYAFLTFVISLIEVGIYKFYCNKHFDESKYKFEFERENIYPMLSFSGWNLYGNLSVVARTQGVNILLNIFFGVVVNAANAIAIQVQNAVLSFANNIIVAVQPQIVKSFAIKNYEYTLMLVFNSTKFVYLLLLMLSMPLIVETDYVLNMWLKNVPPFVVSFCRLTLIFNLVAIISRIIVNTIHATGNVKKPSLINGSLYLLIAPITYLAFKFNAKPEIPFILNIFFVGLGMLINAFILRSYLPGFTLKEFIKKVLSINLIISIISFLISYTIKINLTQGFSRFLLITLTSSIVIIGMSYLIGTDKHIKKLINLKVTETRQKWKKK
jgi:Na+-driven multidrug efflux pump